MSGKGGGGGGSNNGKGNNGISGIPAASRKMVQSLREIVNNYPEHEIYATLKECNMDPNEAISRLLSQDPFHEVKSKREKKKENKDTTESRSRGANNTSNRGGRGVTDRYVGRGGTNQFNTSDSGVLGVKPAYKKENGTHAYGGSTSSVSSMAGNNLNRHPPSCSDLLASEKKTFAVGMGDGILSSSQPSGLQSAWGVPGQVSMADIVKMGRPQGKASAVPNSSSHNVNHQNVWEPPAELQGHASTVSDSNTDLGTAVSQLVSHDDEWTYIEQPHTSGVSRGVEAHADSELYSDSSNLDEAEEHGKAHLDDRLAGDGPVEILNADHVGPASVSARSTQDVDSGFDGNLYKDYQHHRHPFENKEAEDSVASVAANLDQLSLQKDDQGAQSEEHNPSVVIPDHLQLHTPDCLNLSFGSFGSSTKAAFSGPGSFASRPLEDNLEESPEADVSSIGHSNARNPECYGDEHLASTSDGNLVNRTGLSENYEAPSVSQSEVLRQETQEAAQGSQYMFPSSSPGFTYENTQQADAVFPPQTSSQMQNLGPFSSVMAYTNSLPSALLASTVQTARDEIPYSPFPLSQSVPTQYSNVASSISGPSISMPEALRASNISTPQQPPQNLPGASVATGPALPQHLAVHPYSQPALPLGHFANMISYPFLPQSYSYMPSPFQQAFAGNSTYHQSLAAVLPQYKNSVSVSSLSQSAAIPSGYGFGSSTSIPGGNFPLNPPAAPTGTTIGYDDIISSQYKDNNHMLSQLQQNENSAMWVHGPGSRTMSAVPANSYYNLQGQNQQSGGFRQGQQPSQHFSPLGYPNIYHSQAGISLEHQQQNPRDASLNGSQGQPSKQSQQIWQNSY
ncbi:GBF-interacting protein 1 [Quillaja saponaria]|uniref:GBF-interacting protein 1 n=1 Tax=Quillaja saponaria TaxID=32244 RepID=A0AAD7KY33_QUISA|nr:GBF-interacting protein 1 [Quillaja saponaria]